MYVPLMIGFLAAAAVSVYAWLFGLDRSRAFYPAVLIVVASYYLLFGVMSGSREAILLDALVMGGFVVLATLGQVRNLWFVVVGLAGHGVLDAFHGHLINNPGVPQWWPAWCLSYDLAAAGALAILLWHQGRAGGAGLLVQSNQRQSF